MSALFIGRGNLGANPELRFVMVGEEQRSVCELRVYFDRRVPNGEGGFVDRGGFWRDVYYWGRRGEVAARLLVRGARIAVQGVEWEERWPDGESGEERSRSVITADQIDIDPIALETAVFRFRGNAESKDAGSPEGSGEADLLGGEL